MRGFTKSGAFAVLPHLPPPPRNRPALRLLEDGRPLCHHFHPDESSLFFTTSRRLLPGLRWSQSFDFLEAVHLLPSSNITAMKGIKTVYL